MKTFKTQVPSVDVARRILFLAWQSSRVVGMGAFQDRGNQTEEAVWEQAIGNRDYIRNDNKPGDVYADYLFGRMMKLHVKWSDGEVSITDDYRGDYQSFCHRYKDADALYSAAVESMTPAKVTA